MKNTHEHRVSSATEQAFFGPVDGANENRAAHGGVTIRQGALYTIGRWEVWDETPGGITLVRMRGRMEGSVVRMDGDHVYSVIPSDHPETGGRWTARPTEKGIDYVVTLRSWANARSWFRRLRDEEKAAEWEES